MPVKDRNPFGPDVPADVPTSKADIGVSNPFEAPQNVIKCPVCGETTPEKIQTHSTPYEHRRTCTTCGNKWAGGAVTGSSAVHSAQRPEEEDIPDDIRMSGTERWFE